MKNYFKKFSMMFVMTLILTLGICIGAFADDNVVIGTSNLNNTAENSAKVGNQLNLPEIGWKRYDDSDGKILYTGSTTVYNGNVGVWNSTAKYFMSTNYGSKINFKFSGTKLRIFDSVYTDRSSNLSLKIDGDSTNFSDYKSSAGYQILLYEKTGLTSGIHTVEIINNDSTKVFGLDAIDIDDNGYLIDPNELIALDKSSIDIKEGDKQQLTATTTPAGAQVTWSSSDSSIAIVDSNGNVTGIKEGDCTITATTADGLSATCVVTVTPKTAEPTNPDPTDSGKIVNIAHAKGNNTNNAGGDVTIIFHGSADTTLSVVKTADVKEVWVGDNFTYTIVVTNTGTKTAKAVVVNDPAPNHINFNVNGVTTTQGTVDPNSTSKNIIVNVGDIPPSGTVTIKIPATVVM